MTSKQLLLRCPSPFKLWNNTVDLSTRSTEANYLSTAPWLPGVELHDISPLDCNFPSASCNCRTNRDKQTPTCFHFRKCREISQIHEVKYSRTKESITGTHRLYKHSKRVAGSGSKVDSGSERVDSVFIRAPVAPGNPCLLPKKYWPWTAGGDGNLTVCRNWQKNQGFISPLIFKHQPGSGPRIIFAPSSILANDTDAV